MIQIKNLKDRLEELEKTDPQSVEINYIKDLIKLIENGTKWADNK